MLLSHTLTTRGSHVASLAKLPTVVLEEMEQRSGGQTDGDGPSHGTERKVMLLSHTLTTRGSHEASLVKFHRVI